MSIIFKPNNILKKGILTINFACQASWKDLVILKTQTSGLFDEPQELKGLEHSVVLYSLFKLVEFKLTGSPSDANKSKFASSDCTYHKGHFIMTFETLNNFSSVRKVLTLAMAALNPSKIKPLYQKYMQTLGHKFSKEQFVTAATDINAALKKLSCAVTGKINLPADKLAILKEIIKTKFKPEAPAGEKKKIPTRGDFKDKPCMECKSTLGLLLADKYLQQQKIDSMVTEKGLLPLVSSYAKFEDKAKIEKFVDMKLLKINTAKDPNKIKDALEALAVLSGYFRVSDLNFSTKRADLVNAILSCF